MIEAHHGIIHSFPNLLCLIMRDNEFSTRLLRWFGSHGRKDLQWQKDPTPYRVWVSEIMLQQTQVVTVIPYYNRFITRFPDVHSLAVARQDEVLHLWSGLGYYARARNLLKAAQIICDKHEGKFPDSLEEVIALPGIGRSTASAILALSLNQRHAILDGNVKRVLTRLHAIEGWLGKLNVEKQLWQLADQYTPDKHVAEYTQAIMDLGATLCTRSTPRCIDCPLEDRCLAHLEGRETEFPSRHPRKTLPIRDTQMLLLRNNSGHVLLVKRPPTGIWGGLWSFPECSPDSDIAHWCKQHTGCSITDVEHWPTLSHTFSHFQLNISPILVEVESISSHVMENLGSVWYNAAAPGARGLAAPVKNLLGQLQNTT